MLPRSRWKKTASALAAVAALGAGAAVVAPSASAASGSWEGGGLDDLWSQGFLWTSDAAPGAGETATFPDVASSKVVNADAGEGANLLFTGAGYSLRDHPAPIFPLHWPSIASTTAGSNFISVHDVDLAGTTITMSNGGTLEFLQGVDVTGDDLTMSGDGRVVFRRDPMTDLNPILGDDDVFTSVTDFEIDGSGVITWGGDLHVTGGTATVELPTSGTDLFASGGTTELNDSWPGLISVSDEGLVHQNLTASGGARLTGGTLVVGSGQTLSNSDGDALVHPAASTGTTLCDGNIIGVADVLDGTFAMGLDDGDPFGDCFMFLGVQDEPSSFRLAGTFDADIGGSNPNVDQDILGVQGAVDITGAALDLDVSADIPPGTVVFLISNDLVDPVVGQFDGIAEGDVVVSNGRAFVLSYEGGDGNDVVLESLPTLSIAGPVQGPEGDLGGTNTLDFTVSLSAAVESDVTFDVEVNGVSATEDVDFEDPTPTSYTIPGSEDETEVVVSVPIIGDELDEAAENLTVRLTNVEGVEVADDDAIGVILDDDAPPVLTVDDVTVAEGDAGVVEATFTVSLSEISGQPILALADTVPATASSPADFAALDDVPVLFVPGDTSEQVVVEVAGDVADEVDETFFLQLHDITPGTIDEGGSDTGGLGTIDDDDGPTISITDENSLESVDAEFFVTLDEASPQDVSVDYEVVPGTAGADDLELASGTVTVPAGDVEALLVVDVLDDADDEPDETYSVVLGEATDGVVAAADEASAAAGATGNGVITDDDLPPSTTTTSTPSTTSTTSPSVGGAGGGRSLPRTGATVGGLVLVAAGLVLTGLGTQRAGRRRPAG